MIFYKQNYFSSNIRYTKNSVVYEIISTLPLPADNHTLDAGADDLASLAAASTRERTESTSEEMWDPNTAFDRYVKVRFLFPSFSKFRELKSLQSVERMLDIERIKQQAALHRLLDELGIPRLFSRKRNYGLSSLLFQIILNLKYLADNLMSPSVESRPMLGLGQMRTSQTMPAINNFRNGEKSVTPLLIF